VKSQGGELEKAKNKVPKVR